MPAGKPERPVFPDVSSRRKEIPSIPDSEGSSLLVPEAAPLLNGILDGATHKAWLEC